MAKINPKDITPEQRDMIAQMSYGENGSKGSDVVKMTIQTPLNRLASGKKFYGKNIPEIINKKGAFYAVQNKNKPYTWASTGKFPNDKEKRRYAEIRKQTDAVIDDGDYDPKGHTHFFKKNEATGLKKRMNRVGTSDEYELYNE